ncbi:MAG: FAD binding domain-containing protein [Bacillota bacterium]
MTIPDFEYYKPESAKEAVDTYRLLKDEGRRPLYYGGGTEIITMCRTGSISTGAVVDIKGIPECRELGFQGDSLVIGAGVTLSEITESKVFPLLGAAGGRVADHTVQCKVTLGGNIAGTIVFREAALPLLLCDAVADVAGPSGRRSVPFVDIFVDGRLTLEEAEFLVSVSIPRDYTSAAWYHVKRTKMEEIGYPLLTLVALRSGDDARLAVSGMYPHPVRLTSLEQGLSRRSIRQADRVTEAVETLPGGVADDLEGSAEYRKAVFGKVLLDCLSKLSL